ncbi:hypothetical protein I0C86_39520 [Plantactinospora sp. S1510]|uniref:DMSO/TMAO reductase YedYZ heme-binding membrane subunit n=1 Tax=Plantactinospora alkalitolerans TaxID=2789879 RepID=A0ABS0H955_9ACTN|nr:hypothetical protein [Plantactinospora alkalitolerans]MBF9134970.1 hypothetical protein [Plantactinospora alkalitolerans]
MVSWGAVVGTEAEIEERMARTRQIQRASIPKSFTSRGSTPRPRGAVAVLVVSALAALWAAAMLSPIGSLINAYMFVFIVFFAGPVTLVSLSLTVMAGLVATDRIVLLIRHRVLLQSAHRSLGIIAVIALVLHVLTKITAGHISTSKALLPFVSGAGVYVGLGTVAGVLMVSVLWTGLVRVRFAGIGKPWLWRALHSVSYAAWPIALVHGLQAGRAAATWVTVSYLLCVALVAGALLIRLSVSLGRKREEQGQGTGSLAPVGKAARSAGPVRTRLGTAPAKRRTADEIRASRQGSPVTSGHRSATDSQRSGRDSRWDDDTMSGRRSDPDIRIGRSDDTMGGRRSDDTMGGRRSDDTMGGRRSDPDTRIGRSDDTMGGRRSDPDTRIGRADGVDTSTGRDDDRGTRVGRRRRESLNDLRDNGSEAAIDSWARAGESDTTDSAPRRSDRFAVPEVPLERDVATGAGPDAPPSDPELPWDSPRRWATGEPEDPWDRPRRGSDDSAYRRPSADEDEPLRAADRDEPRPPVADEERRSRYDTDGAGRRSWREPDDEPATTGTPRSGRRRRAADEEPATERAGRRAKVDDDAEESTAEWGRAARYEPNLAAGRDDDDDADRPAVIDIASRRSRKSGEPPSRSSRRKKSDDAAEEGAYWTNLKGETR